MTFPKNDINKNSQFAEWPDVESAFILPERRQRFETLKSALQMYLSGISPSQVFKVFGVSRQEIFYYLGRCKARHSDGRIMGYRALTGQARVKSYARKTSYTNDALTDGTGCAGAFSKLMRDYPQIVRIIKTAVGAKSGCSIKAAGLHLMTVHKNIMRELRKAGVKADEYPFNTKSGGYGSLCRYVRNLLDRGEGAATRARYGDAAIDAQMAGTGENGWLEALAPLDLVCYDEQALPFIGILRTYVGDDEVVVPLQRCSICLLVDEGSTAALGYFISTRRRICAGDVLSAIEHLLTPWKPKLLNVSGLEYCEGAGFPSGLIEGFLGRRIGLLKMDNDLTHYANSVLEYMVEKTGYAIQFGKIRRWITRISVEQVFAELQKRHFRQLPSTTGSGPSDPAVSDPVGKAIVNQIELHELEEIVEVALANYNATPKAALFNKTPLERLRRHFSENGRGSVIPALSSEFMAKPHLPEEVFSCVVRGNQAKGRRPYIELDTTHYTSDLLCNSWGMIGKKLKVLVHGDFRTLRAFRENGEEYSPLRVIGQWSRSAHTRSIRIEINRLHREGELKFDHYEDPVSAYQKHLAGKAREKGRKGKISRESNQLARTLRLTDATEYRAPLPDIEIAGKSQPRIPDGLSKPPTNRWRQVFGKPTRSTP